MRNLFLLFLFRKKSGNSNSPVDIFGDRVHDYTFAVSVPHEGDQRPSVMEGLLIHRVMPESSTVSDCLRQLDDKRRLAYNLAATERADYFTAFEYGADGVQSIIVKKNRLTLDSIDTIHAVLSSMPPLYTGVI